MHRKVIGDGYGNVLSIFFRATLSAALLLGSWGCGKKYKASLTEIEYQKALAGKKPTPDSSLIVHGEEITVEEIMEAPTPFKRATGAPAALGEVLSPVARANPKGRFDELARPQVKMVVENKVSEALLYQKAKSGAQSDRLEEALAKAEEQEWRRFVIRHEGDEAKADEALRAQGLDRERFKKTSRRAILSRVHFQEQTSSKRPIVHGELVEYYHQMKDEHFAVLPKIEFKLIDIVADKLDMTDPNADPVEEARRLAADLVQQLKAGGDFASLARAHSHGIFKDKGGQWPERSPDSFVEPYDQVVEAARSASVGDIVGPVEVGGRLFILRLDRWQAKGYKPLSEVQTQIEEKIKEDRYLAALQDLTDEIATLAEAGETAQYVDRCMNEAYSRFHAQ